MMRLQQEWADPMTHAPPSLNHPTTSLSDPNILDPRIFFFRLSIRSQIAKILEEVVLTY